MGRMKRYSNSLRSSWALRSWEYWLLFLGVLGGMASIAIRLYPSLPSSFSIVFGTLSTGLFLTGVIIKIHLIDTALQNITRTISNYALSRKDYDITELLSLYRDAYSSKDQYLQIASKVFVDNIYDRIFQSGRSIIRHAKDGRHGYIEIANITPAYELMHYIIQDLPNSFAYIATSKLSSYDNVSNTQFRNFSTALKDRAASGSIIAARLYYIKDNNIEDQVKTEIEKANLCRIISDYYIAGNKFDTPLINDLAFILRPPERVISNDITIKHDSQENPISYLLANGYREECAIKFYLEPNHTGRDVTKMELFGQSSVHYQDFKSEFITYWDLRALKREI